MIKFQYPIFLLIIPIVILLTILKLKKKQSSGIGFSELTLLKVAAKKNHLTSLPYILRCLTLILLSLALAGPIKENSIENNEASGIDIIVAIDVSGSMEGLDFSTKREKQTRLDAVKKVVKEFIDSRPNDRIGVVAFAGAPYIASPLTLDHSWLIKRLDMLQTGMIEGGTAIGSAIASASNSLNRVESKSKIVILLTDGENNSGVIEPRQAAEAANALGVKIYTVGAGKEGKAPYEVNGFFGSDIQYVDVKIDEEMLTDVATSTGGLYFRAKDINSLEEIYNRINKMEKTTRVSNKTVLYKYYFMIPLIIGFLLFLIEIILTSTKLRRVY
ncbi:VWA domain-containing protein [Thiospirochaeta perfilievii]|uniref:VWA domain-containing protein n=1 Tax=Thiospirochaeta perfilievii TaxID=252967 RepID=A0A5C1QHV7_9SPIO|nr:VWA domain-containing protein [Thiospirochaeta perfilievii]QEN06136.1 VWA domain-containing protein [Thiospirochaeta perfilievii]